MTGLRGMTIVVTRPVNQAGNLCEKIEQLGGKTIRLPLLQIERSEESGKLETRLAGNPDIKWLIFISTNAVNFALAGNNGKIPNIEKVRVAAVGKATASALEEKGIQVDVLPEQAYNSEALLAAPEFSQFSGQQIIIVRGEGGRELLADRLRDRGADVTYLEVYKRTMPDVDRQLLSPGLQQRSISAVILTSVQALQNFRTIWGEDMQAFVQIPFVVISQRIAEQAQGFGFKNLVVSAGPQDDDILTALTGLQRGEQWQR